METITLTDPRRTELKKMSDKAFERYMEFHELWISPTAEELVDEVKAKSLIKKAKCIK